MNTLARMLYKEGYHVSGYIGYRPKIMHRIKVEDENQEYITYYIAPTGDRIILPRGY